MRFPIFSTFGRAGPDGSPGLVSRRRFFGASAGAAGAVLGSGIWTPARSGEHEKDDDEGQHGQHGAACPAADPIPHLNAVISGLGFGAFHVFFPGPADGSAAPIDPEGVHPGRDPSTIFNFDGVIGQADLNLTGTGTDTTTGQSAPYGFHTDMRFMAGRFVGTDGQVHKGAFAFI